MEPADYLKILKRHWKVAAGLVVVMMLAVLIVSPKQPAKVYEARHTLLRDVASGDDGASSVDNPSVVARMATSGEVPQRVAEKVGFEGPPDALAQRVTVTADAEMGAVDIVATANKPDDAMLLANTVAEELVAFIAQREAQRREEEKQAVAARAEEISLELGQLGQEIDGLGGAEAGAASAKVAERDRLTAELTALDEQLNTTTTKWTSLQEATTATEEETSPVAFARGQWLLLAALVSVLLAFGVAIMLDRSDSRLHTKEAVERHFRLPVLAEVPLLPIRSRSRAAVHGYEQDRGVAEAYRSLRTALLLFRDRLPLEVEAAELSGRAAGWSGQQSSTSRQVILVTSPEAGDGKSSTAANLAMAYAEAGQSVLLVNWDLWRPMPAGVFEAEDSPGVSEFLEAGNASLVHFVQSTSVPGLHLVAAGNGGHQPGAQLAAELRLLEEARALADVVIIDTAPILAASVTRTLVTMADVVVLACRAGRTTSPAADRTSELLERLGAPTLGVVLVGVASGLFNDYYGSQGPRTDRLRGSVQSRVEPRSEGRGTGPGYGPPGNGAESGDIFLPPQDPPGRGVKP